LAASGRSLDNCPKESAILLASPRCNNWHMKSLHNIILVTKWRRSLRIRRRRREDLHSWVCGLLKVSGSQF
jgi:hypothetical protein